MNRFALDAAERAVKTAAQVAITFLGADAFNVLSVDWAEVGGLAAGAALVSVLTSVASFNIGDKGTASVVIDG